MVKHIVIWKLKEQAEGAGKQENALKMKAVLEGLREAIREIRHIEVGLNLTDSPDAYDVALYCEFETVAGLKVYQNHPAHLKAIEFIRKVRSERRVVDYEVGPGAGL